MTATTTDGRPTGDVGSAAVRRRVLAVAVGLGVLAACWWGTHPRAFQGPGSEVSGPGTVGEPVYLGLAVVPGDIHLTDATARVLLDSADADVDVLVCRLADVHLGPGVVGPDDLESICRSVGHPTGPADDPDHLVLEVVPWSTGVVVVEGLDVTYRTTLQWGTQTTGMTATVVVEAP